jgi:hypothetical protein
LDPALMPIRPEMKALYPPEWSLISDYIRFDRAMGRCECTGECRGRYHTAYAASTDRIRCPNYHGDPNQWTGSKVVLTTAHLDNDPPNCDPANLLALCQACHLSLDRDLHAATRAANRKKRETQMTLFPEDQDGPPPPMERVEIPQFENDGQAIAWLGTDATRWTAAFLRAADLANAGPDFQHTVFGWFCNAIGAGQSSTHMIPERESWFSDGVAIETLVRPDGWLTLNMRETGVHTGDDRVASVVFDRSFGKATHEALTKWLYPDDVDMCHNGHPFKPGTTTDNETPDAAWCDECGEARKP